MTSEEKKKLEHIVKRYAELEEQKKAAGEEQKELAEAAWEKCGAHKKVVKQLAKEKGWGDIERLAQKQLEENLDECRAALGMLLDTPLGKAAEERAMAH